MGKKFKILLLLISSSFTLGLMSNTYSRYVANTTGDVELAFAKWQILLNNEDITNGATSTLDITPVIEENQNIENNTIAPSSKGYFDVNIDPSNVGVSFNYKIDLKVLNEDMPDLMITKYAILDKDYIDGDEITTTNIENNIINVIGSDCHNLSNRTPNMGKAISIIDNKLGYDMIENIYNTSMYILKWFL